MKEIIKRLKLPSPAIFVTIQIYCIVIGGIVGAIGASILKYFPTYIQMGTVLTSVGGAIAFFGTLIAMIPVKNPELLKTQEEPVVNHIEKVDENNMENK